MVKNFISNFKKQKVVSLLNICCLSLGIMVAIIIGLWVIQELSFDKFHKEKDRIYRVILHATIEGNPMKAGSVHAPLGKIAKDELPQIEDMCRVVITQMDIKLNNTVHPLTRAFLTDPNFFSLFTFPLKHGDPSNVLSTPDKVVISESAAIRYFPDQNPIGQIIKISNQDFTVSGIMRDMPQNSSLQTDFVFSFYKKSDWGEANDFITFFLLPEKIDTEAVSGQILEILYREQDIYKNFNCAISLESLENIHFGSGFINDPLDVKGNQSLLMVFVFVALAILIISCINFVNLFVATSFIRARTVGIKQCFGAGKSLLMREFYLETACYVLVSVVLGLLLALLVLPTFNNFTQSELRIEFMSPHLYAFLAVLFIVTVLLAGSFPALYMTRFNVVETISGKFRGRQVSFFQKSLIVFQFVVSITLLIIAVFMQKQVDYMISYDLGFDKEHIVYVRGRFNSESHFNVFRDELLKEPTITDVARKRVLPSEWMEHWLISKIPSEGQQPVNMEICLVSPNYFDLLGMKLIDGESPFLYESTENNVVINESAVKLLGLDKPVGQMLSVAGGDNLTIKGVVKNAHTRSLHQDVVPQVYMKTNRIWNIIFFKISGDPQRAISFIEQKWKERESEYPFDYHFLDDTYKQLYQSEMNAGKVFSFAMLITLIITVAGLFAMVYYATQRRVREIALRKIHGASVKEIFMLLNKDFLLWVAIAFAIAFPVAYYGLHQWLSGFAVKTPLSIWGFLLVGAIALLVTLLTTGYQTWKAATENPIKALKTE